MIFKPNNFNRLQLYHLLLSIMWLISIQGCGIYSFTGKGIAGVETLAVLPFDNNDPEFGLEEDLVDAVIQRLLSDRTYTVANVNSADAVLRGSIIDVDDKPLSFREDEQATENIVRIVIEVEVSKPGQSEPLKKTRLSADGSYPYVTGSPDERQEGIDKAIEQLVIDMFNWLTSDW